MGIKCKICNKTIKSNQNFLKHIKVSHKLNAKEYNKMFDLIYYCKKCNKRHEGDIGTGKFCSVSCSRSYTASIWYYIEKYGKKSGIKKYANIRKNKSFAQTLLGLQQKHGNKVGREIYDNRCKHSSYSQTIHGYIEKYGEIKGLSLYNKKRKDNSYRHTLKYSIEKYGKSLGIKKYKQKQQNYKRSHTIERYIERFGEIEGKRKFWSVNCSITSTSKAEKEFRSLLTKQLPSLKLEKKRIYSNRPGRDHYIPDIIINDRIIVEFNGDYWHCNPKKYKSLDVVNLRGSGNILVDDIWEKDRKRINEFLEQGYRVIVVWETEFKNNKITTVDRVVRKINNEMQNM